MFFDTLTIVTLCLLVSFIFAEWFFRHKFPRVIGQILTGVIFGLPFIRILFSPEAITDIRFLSELGIIFLLLITGMKIDLEKFKKSERETIIIALLSVFVPFTLGFVFMKAVGYSSLVALIFGACISLTAEGTKLKVLMDLRALNSKVGITMLGAGILDDVFEVIFLSIVIVLSENSFTGLFLLPLKILLFVMLVFVFYKLFPKILRIIQRERSRIATFSLVILFGLIVAVASTKLELGPIIGAFIAGVIIRLVDRRKSEFRQNVKELEAMTFAFIIPFFFINIGLHFDVSVFSQNIYFALMVLLVATVSKILGALLAKPWTTFSFKQLHLIGWGLNSRGAIELVIAQIALDNHLIPIEVYSALVVMAIVTTLVFPLVTKFMVAKDRKALLSGE